MSFSFLSEVRYFKYVIFGSPFYNSSSSLFAHSFTSNRSKHVELFILNRQELAVTGYDKYGILVSENEAAYASLRSAVTTVGLPDSKRYANATPKASLIAWAVITAW